MKTIKDRNLITAEYCTQLEAWIKENPLTFFGKDNECHGWGDFCYWPDKPMDRNHLIMSGEVCIIDRNWQGRHAYVVCQFYAKGTKVKDLYRVIWVDHLNRSDWKNGYFLIPDLRKEGQV